MVDILVIKNFEIFEIKLAKKYIYKWSCSTVEKAAYFLSILCPWCGRGRAAHGKSHQPHRAQNLPRSTRAFKHESQEKWKVFFVQFSIFFTTLQFVRNASSSSPKNVSAEVKDIYITSGASDLTQIFTLNSDQHPKPSSNMETYWN